jgi:hypothetical protein
MGCTYNVKGSDSLSLSGIVQLYYKSKNALVASNIYSTDTKNSVESIIFEQVNKKDEILKLNRIALTDFIGKQNDTLLKKIGLSNMRFAPEYDEAKRILQYVKDKLKDAGNSKESLEELDLKDIKNNPNFSEATEYEKEIISVIEAENKTNKLIGAIKTAI